MFFFVFGTSSTIVVVPKILAQTQESPVFIEVQDAGTHSTRSKQACDWLEQCLYSPLLARADRPLGATEGDRAGTAFWAARETARFGRDRVFIKTIIVEGSTVFDQEELHKVTAPFEGKYATSEELQAIRIAITDLYVSSGYITSGAFLPSQDLTEGIVRVQVVEGRLEKIEVKGLTRLSSNYVRDRLKRFSQTPLNINKLEDGLKLLQLNPLFDFVSASLEAGLSKGESILVVNLTEAQSFSLTLEVDNSLPSNIGSVRGTVAISEINFLGFGDGLNLSYDLAEGLNQLNFSYEFPLNAKDGTLSISYQNQQNRLIEDPLESLGINSKYNEVSISYRQPVIKTSSNELALFLAFNLKESKTFLFDDFPFSFSSQVKNGETRLRTLDFSQEWLNRSSQRILAIRSKLSFGLDAFDATNSNFFVWLGQFQWLQKVSEEAIIVTQLAVQLSPDQLLPQEQFDIGGVYTVRGYKERLSPW